jgi:hypothetical protein
MNWYLIEIPTSDIFMGNIHTIFLDKLINRSDDVHVPAGTALLIDRQPERYKFYVTPEAAQAFPEFVESFHGMPCEQPSTANLSIFAGNPGRWMAGS